MSLNGNDYNNVDQINPENNIVAVHYEGPNPAGNIFRNYIATVLYDQ